MNTYNKCKEQNKRLERNPTLSVIKLNFWLSKEALQTAVKRREVNSKGEKERYKHLNAESPRIAKRDKKAFFSDQCKEIEENNRMGKTSSRKLEIPREHFMQRWAQ